MEKSMKKLNLLKYSKSFLFPTNNYSSIFKFNRKLFSLNNDGKDTRDSFKNSSENLDEKERSFGFKNVKMNLHQNLVNEVFSNVASKYDLMNDVMSLGVHRLWKTEFVNSIGQIRPNYNYDNDGKCNITPMRIIDVAGGTGDISLKILEKAEEYFSKDINSTYPVEISVVDINKNMLEEGKKKCEEKGIDQSKLNFIECNAENLSFLKDSSVDLYTISFGIRNCTRRDNVLKEAFRVLKRGGRIMCMEFSHVQIPVFDKFYDFYSTNIIPELGGFFANDKDSYKYLIESIKKFPTQEDFKKEFVEAGFSFTKYVNLSGGIVAIHSGVKI